MIDKFAEILAVAKQPALKQHIIEKCSLSSTTFNNYIHQLLQSGLLDVYPALDRIPGPKTRRRMVYQTSQKGLEFLKRYREMLTLLEISVKYYPQVKF